MRGMTEPEVFVLADRALDRVVAQIPDGAWAMQLPASFATRRIDHTPTLGEIVNYHACDDAWVPDMLAGRTMEEAGREKFDGDLLGDDPKRSFAAIVAGACAAAIEVDAPRSRGALLLRRLPGTPLLLADHPVPRPAGPRHRLLGLTGRDPAA